MWAVQQSSLCVQESPHKKVLGECSKKFKTGELDLVPFSTESKTIRIIIGSSVGLDTEVHSAGPDFCIKEPDWLNLVVGLGKGGYALLITSDKAA